MSPALGAAVRYLPAAPVTWTREADVVVVGAGVAGLSAALEASAHGRRVLLVCKSGLDAGSSPLAQGGLAAVLDPADTRELHRQDTLTAGAGLCDDAAVDVLVSAAPGEIAWLAALGARFDAGPLGLEGGHSRPRIVHAGGDASGAEVHRVLRDAVLDSPVEILDHTVALDALLDEQGQVAGVLVAAPAGPTGAPGGRRLAVGAIRAAAVVLASGGYGQAYATTTNPLGATGDGLALAVRAGAEVSDLEFMQFHPTVLWQPGARGQQPLITEALRGAGAVLIDASGRPVMAGRHPLADLAPRDVVAAEMHRRMAAGDGPATHLWLDATAIGRDRLADHFPTVTAACRAAGIEPSSDPIPVAPGAHYACGGIRADMAGRTTLAGLYAIGEVAATGVHGANRLASNSLTEAIITGRRLGRLLGSGLPPGPLPAGRSAVGFPAAPMVTAGSPPAIAGAADGAGAWPGSRADLAAAMSRYAGVLRDETGLEHLLQLLAAAQPAATHPLDLDTVEATNLHAVCVLVATAALTRTESRGCHRRSDAPWTRPEPARRIGMIRCRDGELDVHLDDQVAALAGAPA
ncbi:MAG TPA: FAD-binding protein [Streptosporangiaceae bacterium]|nr:FAD-binding protein [Streptosporangiaceae bacterium]